MSETEVGRVMQELNRNADFRIAQLRSAAAVVSQFMVIREELHHHRVPVDKIDMVAAELTAGLFAGTSG